MKAESHNVVQNNNKSNFSELHSSAVDSVRKESHFRLTRLQYLALLLNLLETLSIRVVIVSFVEKIPILLLIQSTAFPSK